MENLLKYYPNDKEIPLGVMKSGDIYEKGIKYSESNLVDELDIYDSARDELLAEMFRFEKTVYDNYHNRLNKKENGYIEHYDCLVFVKEELELGKEISFLPLDEFIGLRNSILHNKIPYTDWIKEKISSDQDPMITRRIINLILNIYVKMNESLKETTKNGAN